MLTLYVLVNGSLKMSKGKIASQVAHAVAGLAADDPLHHLERFAEHDPRKVVILEAKDGEQMRNMKEYLDKNKVHNSCYIDEGNYETDPFSMTALAIGPLDTAHYGIEDDVSEMLEPFPLLGKKKHKWF